MTLSNVRYVPEMGRNLISYGQLEQSWCTYTGRDYLVEFYLGTTKVLTGKYANGLYYLQGILKPAEANSSEASIDHSKKWHSRLGHMNIRSMETLVKKGYLNKEEVGSLGFCEACTMGKSHRQKFPRAKHTSKGVLAYIHSDLWGSPKWKLLVENQTGKRIKCLRTDNGLEFCNQSMDKLCRDSGIKRHKTCSYTPQQNGVSERMNRSIMDKVRSMLHETGLDASYWTEAASTTVYLINRSPNSSIEFEIPEVKWSGRSISYDHLRSFGCNSYVHQVKEKTSARATKGVFMGYAEGTKGYIIWLFSEEKIVISKDVVFNEQSFYKDMKKDEDIDRTPEETARRPPLRGQW